MRRKNESLRGGPNGLWPGVLGSRVRLSRGVRTTVLYVGAHNDPHRAMVIEAMCTARLVPRHGQLDAITTRTKPQNNGKRHQLAQSTRH